MISIGPMHLARGVVLFWLAIGAAILPPKIVFPALMLLGVVMLPGIAMLAWVAHLRVHSAKADVPGWANDTMAPMRGIFVFNLLMVLTGLVVLWHVYPLWGGA